LNWQERSRVIRQQNAQRLRMSTSPKLPLSPREEMVAKLFADNHSVEQIARALDIAPDTVRTHLARTRAKFKNAGRDASKRSAMRMRLIEDSLLNE